MCTTVAVSTAGGATGLIPTRMLPSEIAFMLQVPGWCLAAHQLLPRAEVVAEAQPVVAGAAEAQPIIARAAGVVGVAKAAGAVGVAKAAGAAPQMLLLQQMYHLH